LDALVDEHLKAHGGDPHRSLAALTPLPPSAQRDLESVADPQVQDSLAQVGATWPDLRPASDSLGGLVPPIPPASPRARYRVVRPHARGGLGEVFVAEDTELGRQVALKEIRPERAGDAASRQRFVLEAEITGGLEHPGVVPVYGLGSYADGRPYYAMRFIQGDTLQEAIRRFHADGPAAARGIAFRELLGRFVDICQAVAYAHSRGVLHRDLKPANVMLGRYGETLVVDWGLAKPLGRRDAGDGGEATLRPRAGVVSSVTVVGSALGTPVYMSPEQAAGRLDELGPASDVYSLGATLYELLTGRAPFGASYVDMILEDVRAGRFPPPRAVSPEVPPALEAVCLKAMALKPGDRYTTALELADDVGRWLADEPVRAHREPWADRARRWSRRHRTLVTGAAAALLVGVVSLGAATALLTVAHRREHEARLGEQAARGEAQAERDIARAQKRRTREALDAMTSQVTADWLATQKTLLESQQAFLRRALAYYQEFAREAATDEAGRELVADAQFRVGLMLQRLGQNDEAEAAYRQATKLRERLADDFPAEPRYRRDLAEGLMNLGVLLKHLGRGGEAEAAHRRAVNLRARLVTVRDGKAQAGDLSELALSLFNLGALLQEQGKAGEAGTSYRQAIAFQEQLVEAVPASAEYRCRLAASYHNLGVLLDGLGQTEEAVKHRRQAVALQERLVEEEPTNAEYRGDLAAGHLNLGTQMYALGKLDEAETAFRRSIAQRERLAEEAPGIPEYREGLASALNNLGVLLKETDRGREAEAAYRRAILLQEHLAAGARAVPEYRNALARSFSNLGVLLRHLKRDAEAEAAHRESVRLREGLVKEADSVPEFRSNLADSLINLGALLQGLNKAGEAETAYRRAAGWLEGLAAENGAAPAYARDLGLVYTNLGLLAETSRPREAVDWYGKAVKTLEPISQRDSGVKEARRRLEKALLLWANALSQLGEHAAAVPAWDRLIALSDPDDRDALRLPRSRSLALSGQPERAVAEAESLAAAYDEFPDTLYATAAACALASAAVRADGPQADRYAARAVALLRRAFTRGYTDVGQLQTDADLASLHGRADFTDLLWELADWPPTRR
jgi:serine/threonine-protein kinase